MPRITSLAQVAADLKRASICPTCGKSTVVLNTAAYRQPFKGEPVSATTHCDCRSGPAYDPDEMIQDRKARILGGGYPF